MFNSYKAIASVVAFALLIGYYQYTTHKIETQDIEISNLKVELQVVDSNNKVHLVQDKITAIKEIHDSKPYTDINTTDGNYTINF